VEDAAVPLKTFIIITMLMITRSY